MRRRRLRTPEDEVRRLQDRLHQSAKRDASGAGRGTRNTPTTALCGPVGASSPVGSPAAAYPRMPEKEWELRKPYAGKPHVRFDEGVLETESRKGLRHRQNRESRR